MSPRRLKPSPLPEPEAKAVQRNPEAQRARVYEPGWRYTPSGATDISKTFARARKQMKEAAAQPPANVKAIRQVKKAGT